MPSVKKKVIKSKKLKSLFSSNSDWDQIVFDLKNDLIICKKFVADSEPSDDEIKGLWAKVPYNTCHVIKRFLKANENKQGKITPRKIYDILAYLVERHEKFGFTWEEIARATEIALQKGIKNKRYIGGILRGEREKQKMRGKK